MTSYSELKTKKQLIKLENKKILREYLKNTTKSDKKVQPSREFDDKLERYMNYTIKDYLNWNDLKLKSNSNKLNMSTYNNYNKLAELSYNKLINSISNIDILTFTKNEDDRKLKKRKLVPLDRNIVFSKKLKRELKNDDY